MLRLLSKASKITPTPLNQSLGLLFMRICLGLTMLFSHGLGKLMAFPDSAASFPDPLGFGSTVSMALAIFAECLCASLVVFGLFTRLALIPLIITMATAIVIIHADDPWQKKEFAMLYLVPFIGLFFTGPGSISLDRVLFK